MVTDTNGTVYEGEAHLAASQPAKAIGNPSKPKPTSAARNDIDFSLPLRAFVTRYGKTLSGAQKFTMIAARLTEGKLGTPVAIRDVVKQWNSMTQQLGGRFNPSYTTRAKNAGWVDAGTARGTVVLLKDWKLALDAL